MTEITNQTPVNELGEALEKINATLQYREGKWVVGFEYKLKFVQIQGGTPGEAVRKALTFNSTYGDKVE